MKIENFKQVEKLMKELDSIEGLIIECNPSTIERLTTRDSGLYLSSRWPEKANTIIKDYIEVAVEAIKINLEILKEETIRKIEVL